MVSHNSAPVLITGGARRIGLALAKSFLQRGVPVIIAYRSEYPALAELQDLGAICLQGDFSAHEGIYRFADQVKQVAPKLRAVIHNASAWLAESTETPPEQVMASMLQIHVYTPYLLNQLLEPCLLGQGQAGADIIHLTDYVVEKGSDKHIAYAASKAALDNMTRSFARKLAPDVKVNAIAPALIMFNTGDDEAYRQQALTKSLMQIAPGESEVVNLVDYLMGSRYVTGRTHGVDGGRPLR
ncbi:MULTISPECIES: dihydromonapterin reductase [Serratia]|jgi:dihydromonapterin reductase/dihydrofolate reductase|uniref:Dihydromonapterin reductase n=1 Tax=Serratia fonticola TaxID=47917 RepID=A0AAJ1YAU9_SERFO|nr:MULTISPECIES: dihydromonapterin reductase [Serratia]MBE0148452.1 dihydromonapterin reductase [Serratia fonticola]MDQ7207895.1 dihydromonapterin reductase [Serratia fonticola]MDQ9125210.1 dihydromonapterin reductase [Serratia fonticola]OKP29221.1 dihydromonapterin reductase [Serratia fonticola]CAI2049468.1 Dihydrofolate reductase folM [Serratia fonticola]